MIPEREREALMRLTMCARGECPMCKYEEQCDDWDFRMELATKNMNILADALRKTEPSNSEFPNNCEDCKWWFGYCHLEECEYEPKDEPTISKMEQVDEPQISPFDCMTCKHDLWSTPRTCGKCSRQEDGKPSMYEPKDEPQTEREDK